MEFVDFLEVTSPLIGGQVTNVLESGSAFLSSDFELPTRRGKAVTDFFVPRHEAAGLKKYASVVFRWKRPGQLGDPDPRRGDDKAPEACDVQVVEESVRKRATQSLRAQRKLLGDLEILLRDDMDLESAISESATLLEDPPTAVATAVQIYERARKLVASERRLEGKLSELETQIDSKSRELNDLSSRQEMVRKDEERLAPLKAFAAAVRHQEAGPRQPEVEAADVTMEQLDAALGGVATPFARRATVLSLLTAALHGRLLLLDGPVGAGKTTVAERIATVCGGGCDVIPVRPSWVEPADLLGFYDPLSRVFRPGLLTESVQRPITDRVNAVVLDEMNLARIENYAADLLSRAESIADAHRRGDDPVGIPVWSPAEWHALKAEWEILDSIKEPLLPETNNRLMQLRHCFQYNPTISLADGTIFVGTLNTDDTTYDLSPKVIDRSFAISIPAADLQGADGIRTDSRHGVSIERLRKFVSDTQHPGRDRLLKKLLDTVDQETMAQLGVPYSYRVLRDFESFTTIGLYLDAGEDEVLSMFIFARVLPRLRFFKDDARTSIALDALARVRDVGPSTPDRAWNSQLDRLEHQCKSERARLVRFWHGEPA